MPFKKTKPNLSVVIITLELEHFKTNFQNAWNGKLYLFEFEFLDLTKF
jgi:hypothetical protein